MTRIERWLAVALLVTSLATLIACGEVLVYATETKRQRPFYQNILREIREQQVDQQRQLVEMQADRTLLIERTAVSEANGKKLDELLRRSEAAK